MGTTAPYWKDKIGSHLNYPVKFAELCQLLSPAIEQLNIEVWFWAWKAPRQNETRETYSVLEARYSPRAEQWQLSTSPVSRSLRPDIRALLLPALPERIRPWLLRQRGLGWHLRDHSLLSVA